MDLLTHAVTGAAMGQAFGRPVLGAVCACLPDAVLGLKRHPGPAPARYMFTHSLAFVALVGAVLGILAGNTLVPAIAVLSHVLLDLPTHGPRWGPALLYPYSNDHFTLGNDWEWFNREWLIGLGIAIVWSAVWLLL